MPKWKVRYLIAYRDENRWGESVAYNRANAFMWVAKADPSFLVVEIYFGPKLMGEWKRDGSGNLRRIWNAA